MLSAKVKSESENIYLVKFSKYWYEKKSISLTDWRRKTGQHSPSLHDNTLFDIYLIHFNRCVLNHHHGGLFTRIALSNVWLL